MGKSSNSYSLSHRICMCRRPVTHLCHITHWCKKPKTTKYTHKYFDIFRLNLFDMSRMQMKSKLWEMNCHRKSKVRSLFLVHFLSIFPTFVSIFSILQTLSESLLSTDKVAKIRHPWLKKRSKEKSHKKGLKLQPKFSNENFISLFSFDDFSFSFLNSK